METTQQSHYNGRLVMLWLWVVAIKNDLSDYCPYRMNQRYGCTGQFRWK
jgi:hypothetical protein